MYQQVIDFSVKKYPSQVRSKATFGAIVEACARLLGEMGYQRVTTNHVAEAAGVAISSLYEYFPNKDAIVAQVAEGLAERVMAALVEAVPDVLQQQEGDAMDYWVRVVFRVLYKEKALLRAFYYEVPYTNQLPVVKTIVPRLMTFSQNMQSEVGKERVMRYDRASWYLIVNLVSTTIYQLILDPPQDVSRDELLKALAYRVNNWVLETAA